MTEHLVGSVKAELTLDTKPLTESLKTVKKSLEDLKNSFKFLNSDKLNSLKGFAKNLKETTKESSNAKKNLDDMSKALDNVSKKSGDVVKNLKDTSNSIKKFNSGLNSKSVDTYTSSMEKLSKSVKNTQSTMDSFYKKASKQSSDPYFTNISANTKSNITNGFKLLEQQLTGFFGGLNTTTRKLQDRFGNFVNLDKETGIYQAKLKHNAQQKIKADRDYARKVFNNTVMPSSFAGNSFANQVQQQLQKEAKQLEMAQKLYEQRLKYITEAGVKAHQQFIQNQAKLGNGYQNYLSQKNNPNLVRSANYNYKDDIKGWNTYLNSIKEPNKGEQLKNTKKGLDEVNKSTSNMGKSMEEASNKTGKLTNTLGQLVNAGGMVKSIFSMVSSIFIWQFANGLINTASETVTAKLEMESLFQTMDMGNGSITRFMQSLDKTVDKYKKLNKYSMGETVASLGVEFELTNGQMEKAMPILAMIQSEYLRAGRSAEEATLAVKDIMQGELLRLSRETGVGQSELKNAGWNGMVQTKEDIDSLLDALNKVGTSRHWDVFASKASSLNDVILISTNRVSEFVADVVSFISPAVIGGFNLLSDIIGGVVGAFEGLSDTNKVIVGVTGLIGAITGLGVAFAGIRNGMGLVEIANVGLGKSIIGAILKIDKETLATYKLREAIISMVTGVKLSKVEQYGWLTTLKSTILGIDLSTASNIKWHQSLALITTGMSETEVQTLKWNQSLKAVMTSMATIKAMAFAGVIIAIAVAFGLLYQHCQEAKKSVEGFNYVLENGEDITNNAKETYNHLTNRVSELKGELSSLKEGTKEYTMKQEELNQALTDQSTAYNNIKDSQEAYKRASEIQRKLDQKQASARIKNQEALQKTYKEIGLSSREAYVKASKYLNDVERGGVVLEKAMSQYTERLRSGSAHWVEHSKQMKEAGNSTKEISRYIDDYNTQLFETAEHWKKFNEGDMMSGLYAILGELTLAWIDIASHPEVVNFFNALNDIWTDIQPTLKAVGQLLEDYLIQGLGALGDILNGLNKYVGSGGVIVALTTGVYGLAKALKYLKEEAVGGKILDKLTTVLTDKGLPDVFGRNKKDKKDDGSKSKDKKGKSSSGSFGTDVKSDFLSRARTGLKLATDLAIGIGIITEAILLLHAPLWSFGQLGSYFNGIEPQVRKGIEAVKLLSNTLKECLPIVGAFVIGVIALSQIKITPDKFMYAALGIAGGFILIAESIFMLIAPLLALAALGWISGWIEPQVEQGIKAINSIGDALKALVPVLPVFALGIGMVALATTGVGAVIDIVIVLGIIQGIQLVSETILLLTAPLIAIGLLGSIPINVKAVEEGSKKIKLVCEAIEYVQEGMDALAKISLDEFQTLSFSGKDLKGYLEEVTAEDGVLVALKDFPKNFNSAFEGIEALDETKVKSLEATSKLIERIKTTMDNVNSFNNKNPLMKSNALDLDNKFANILNDVKSINTFARRLNEEIGTVSQPPEGLAESIQSTATLISNLENAIERVKSTVTLSKEASQEAVNSRGYGGQGYALFSGSATETDTGKSPLKTALTQVYNDLKALIGFNEKVGGLKINNPDTSALSTLSQLATDVSAALGKVNTALTEGKKGVVESARSYGKAIVDGIKFGMSTLEGEIRNCITKINYGEACKNLGRKMGETIVNGFKFKIDDMSKAMDKEITDVINVLNGRGEELRSAGATAGSKAASGFTSKGLGRASPGIMARNTRAEVNDINRFLIEGQSVLASTSEILGSSIVGAYNPVISTLNNVSTGLMDIQATDVQLGVTGVPNDGDMLSQYKSDVGMALSLSDTAVDGSISAFNSMDTSLGYTFGNMGMTVMDTFNGINLNATNGYTQLTNTTKVQLGNMQSQTTRNINAIQTSWRGMQTALIGSAENIRSQTSQKISNLEGNMARFWRKVQNPALLIAGAGGISSSRGTNTGRSISSRRSVARMIPSGMYAGHTSPTGINTTRYPLKKSHGSPTDLKLELLECLNEGGGCYAGWGFNWTPQIKRNMDNWRTHFGPVYDGKLRVGKFENNDFPVRGDADIFRKYIVDAISRTTYEKYFNSKYGSALAAWNAGSFNCYDGALVVMALANAFGFTSELRHGHWDGIPHVWAYVHGVGDVDATAIQGGYGLTSPKVSGGSPSRSWSKWASQDNTSNTTNKTSNVNLTVNVDMTGSTVSDRDIGDKIGEVVVEKVSDLLGVNPATGL